MILTIFTVYDNKAQTFAQPFYSPTLGSALRAFADHVNEPGSPPNKHPKDYELWQLGTFDDQDAMIVPLQKPNRVGTAQEYKHKENTK